MNKKIMLISFLAGFCIFFANFTSVIGIQNTKPISESPLFNIRTGYTIDKNNLLYTKFDFIGKNEANNIFTLSTNKEQWVLQKTQFIINKLSEEEYLVFKNNVIDEAFETGLGSDYMIQGIESMFLMFRNSNFIDSDILQRKHNLDITSGGFCFVFTCLLDAILHLIVRIINTLRYGGSFCFGFYIASV